MAAPYSKIRTSPSCRQAHLAVPSRHRLRKCQVREENVALRENVHRSRAFLEARQPRPVTHLKGCASCCWNFKMRGRATLASMRPSLASPGKRGTRLQAPGAWETPNLVPESLARGHLSPFPPWTKWLTLLARQTSIWMALGNKMVGACECPQDTRREQVRCLVIRRLDHTVGIGGRAQ